MNDYILQAIDEELDRLMQARAILLGSEASTAPAAGKIRRNLSAKARRAIVDAQRRRWDKVHSLKKAEAAQNSTARKEPAAD